MERQALLSQLQLRSLELVQSSPSARKPLPSQRAPNSTRTLVKLYLTREILEECLQSLDIFRELLDDPIQRSKLLRDVGKNIQLKLYDEGAVVYERGEIATSLFMVIRGEVSLCLPGDQQAEGQEIDVCREGVGFGEAEFVHGRKRTLMARARVGETVVGVLQAEAFEEVIQLYRQRVYLRKVQLFGNCPLLHELQPYQLQFIVHNAKPVTFPIGKEVISKGHPARTIFLITEGALQLRTDAPSSCPSPQLMKYRTNSKAKLQDVLKEKIKLKRLVVGTVEEGQFLGDCQLALSVPHACDAVVKTARVRAYACDERIILSQMTPELLSAAAKHYRRKQRLREDKPQVYQQAKKHLQRRLDAQHSVRLTPLQQKAKRIIISRYAEPVPSLVGRLSPKEISRIIDRKCARVKTQPIEEVCFPVLNVSPLKRLAVDQHAYSPLLRQERSGGKKRPEVSLMQTPQRYQHQTLEEAGIERSETRPKLVFMRPFVKKVLSLHERLSKEYNQQVKGLKRQQNYSVIEMRRFGSGLG